MARLEDAEYTAILKALYFEAMFEQEKAARYKTEMEEATRFWVKEKDASQTFALPFFEPVKSVFYTSALDERELSLGQACPEKTQFEKKSGPQMRGNDIAELIDAKDTPLEVFRAEVRAAQHLVAQFEAEARNEQEEAKMLLKIGRGTSQ